MNTILEIRMEYILIPIIIVIAGILTFFICRWLLKKIIQTPRKRKVITWVTTVVFTPFLLTGIIALYFFCTSYYPNKTFDKTLWVEKSQKRYELASDLIERKLLVGKTKKEVREILGDNGENLDKDNSWYYYLGYPPGQMFNLDPDVLCIEFKNDRVFSVKHDKG